MKKTVLREYARLIVRSGVNVQKGQEVLIYADLDQPEFVQMVVEEAYKAKAKKVTVEWNYQPLQKLHVRHQSVKTLGEVPEWQKARLQHYVDVIPCRIHLMSEDPDGLKGINMGKLAKSRQLRYPIVKPYSDQLENKDRVVHCRRPRRGLGEESLPRNAHRRRHGEAVGGHPVHLPRDRRPCEGVGGAQHRPA